MSSKLVTCPSDSANVKVLSDLSFRVSKGNSLAIIGPNGAGKTVLFRALIGSVPFEGSLQWAPGIRIGYVPQKLDLERDIPLTGIDFLRARAALAGTSSANVSQILGLEGVPAEIAQQPIGTMSGGQFQRLLVAFALVVNPNVLLLDEPRAGVDERGQERLNARFCQSRRPPRSPRNEWPKRSLASCVVCDEIRL